MEWTPATTVLTLGSTPITPAMRRLLLLTAVCALLCAPAAASAATTWTIKGAGFGHGIGMSQYGAYGQARVGRNYQQILGHYYSGTVVSMTRPRTIRVLLQASVPRVSFSGATQIGNRRLSAAKTYVAKPGGGGIVVRDSRGKLAGRFTTAPVSVSGAAGYTFLNGSPYRGAIELRPGTAGGVTAVNALGLDAYVQGVVPGEMPSNWAPEALKAQAVAARTYALTTDAGGAVFDQFADTRSQVYKGMSAEVGSTNAAVRATANQVVTYNRQLVTTYFFSTSGGRTEDVQNVFYGALSAPYLKSVSDPYDGIAPRHRWTFGPYSRKQIGARFHGLCRGSFGALKVRQRGVSPRIVSADVHCSRGVVRTTGAQLRSTLGLYDSWFSIVRVDSSATQRSGSLGAALARIFSPRSVSGRVGPTPRAGSPVTVERRVGRRWRRAASGRTSANGAYDVPVGRPGSYRVRVSGATGPVLSVR